MTGGYREDLAYVHRAGFEDLAAKNLDVDVLVLNAAKFATPTPLMELGTDELWSFMETNVHGVMRLTEMFVKQNTMKQKV